MSANALAEPLHLAFEQAGGIDVGAEAVEAVRIEAGRHEFTVDMNRETIPLEAGIEKEAISFTKGCYPGQEVVIRILHRGHGRIARKLTGMVVRDEVVPASGDRVFAAGSEIGMSDATYRRLPCLPSPSGRRGGPPDRPSRSRTATGGWPPSSACTLWHEP
jgi:folate-binding protein YgfZ